MTRSCLTAVLVTCRYEPCCLSIVRTSATTKPAASMASWIAVQTALLELWKTTVIQRPGLSTLRYSSKQRCIRRWYSGSPFFLKRSTMASGTAFVRTPCQDSTRKLRSA